MKRALVFIFGLVIAIGFAIPGQAKKHHKHHRAHATRTAYRSSSMLNAKDRAIARAQGREDARMMGCVDTCSAAIGTLSLGSAATANSATAAICPSLQTDIEDACEFSFSSAPPPSLSEQIEHIISSSDTAVNNYYYTYVPPKFVTVGGFTTKVTGNPMYFSFIKHRHGLPMAMHNHKGEDTTVAGKGTLPESIGTNGYSTTTIER